MIWYLYILCNDHHTMSLTHIVTHAFLGMRTFKSCSLNNFQIYSTVLLTIVTTLCVTSSGHIHLITGSLHLLTTTTHSTYRSLPTSGQRPICSLNILPLLVLFTHLFHQKLTQKMQPQPEWLLACSRLSCAFQPFPIHLLVAPAFGLRQNLLGLLSNPQILTFQDHSPYKRFWKPHCSDALTQAFPSVLGWLLHLGFHVQTLQELLVDSWVSWLHRSACMT